MKRSVHALALGVLLAGAAPVGAGLAARTLMTPHARSSPVSICGSPHLASPDYQAPDTVDYYVEENVVNATSTAFVHLAAYAMPHSQNLGTPQVVAFKVLDGNYTTLPQDPAHGGIWSVSANPCQPTPESGSKSDRYDFEGTWIAPINPGSYELEATFVFVDGAVVNYLVNVEVVGQDVLHMPRFNSYVRDSIDLHGLSQTLQNTVNNAYDLTAVPAQLDLVTTYYFQGNPAPVASQSKMANAMLNPAVANQNVFQNSDTSGANVRGGTDNRITLPPSGRIAPFTYQQTYIGDDQHMHEIGQTGDVSVEPYNMPAGVVSDQSYTYRVVVHEPVTVRVGDSRNPTYLLKVGSYAVDNGFFGPVADGQGTVGVNFGDGQGVEFYANPGRALLDSSSDQRHCDGDTSRTCIYWAPVPPSAVGAQTTVRYLLTILDPHVPRGEDPTVATATTTTPWADLDPRLIGATSGVTYTAYVQAQFEITDDSGKAAPPIQSDSLQSTITTGAPSVPATDTPIPTPTNTFVPTATPAPTETPTPIPHGEATVVQTAGAYAWIRTSHAEDNAAQDALIPTTKHSADFAHFYWPVGRPLHLLPAVDAHPEDTTLTLIDANTGAWTMLHPVDVRNDWYQVSDPGPGCHAPPIHHVAYAASPAYPDEVDPTRAAPFTILWATNDVPGDVAAGTTRCDVTQVVTRDAPTTMSLTYTVQQRLTFALTFAPGPSAGGCVMVRPTPAPTPSGDGDPPAPPPAFATPGLVPATCRASGVGIGAAEVAVRQLHTIDGGTIIGAPLLRQGFDADGNAALQIELVIQRPLVLRYTLLFRRTVK